VEAYAPPVISLSNTFTSLNMLNQTLNLLPVYENEKQMSTDNSNADTDTLLNENSCSVAEEAENVVSLI
jgi:hypothetical protein